jgi:hypothetical protein
MATTSQTSTLANEPILSSVYEKTPVATPDLDIQVVKADSPADGDSTPRYLTGAKLAIVVM